MRFLLFIVVRSIPGCRLQYHLWTVGYAIDLEFAKNMYRRGEILIDLISNQMPVNS